jgi:hypothetical protein
MDGYVDISTCSSGLMAHLARLLARRRERQQLVRAAKGEQVCVRPAAAAVILVKLDAACRLVQYTQQDHPGDTIDSFGASEAV